MKRRSIRPRLALVLALALTMAACAKAPASLSPAGVADFNAARVIKGLDTFMDVAIVAEAQKPPLVATSTTRRIVEYHQVAVRTIAARPAGWQAQLLTGLEGTVATLSPPERQIFAAYVTLVKTLLMEVQ